MAEMSLEEAASHLGSVYSALIHEKLGPLSGEDLPRSMTPTRNRLHPFRLEPDSKIRPALTLAIYPEVVAPRSAELRNAVYINSLRTFLPACRSALLSETNERLLRQMIELELLKRRFNRPGVDDQLHESAKRIWHPTLPGADSEPPPAEPTNEKQTSQSEAETLPGSATKSSEPREKNSRYETSPAYYSPVYMGRQKFLSAIKNERDALETQDAESPEAEGNRARPNEAKEISILLAAIAVHPQAENLIRLYAASPLKGTEQILLEIKKASKATDELHDQLTTPETRDDAWGYAPLVVGAVTRLGLHDVHGLPEFAVAMGQLLKQTDTNIVLSAASLLMISLSIAFSGGAGAVVVGALDLALAGTSLGIDLLRMHEQEIAATATDFSSEEKKLADHAKEGDAALSVAGAFLSAVALVGAIKGAVTAKQLLSTRPRSPEALKLGAKQSRPKKLDYSDHSEGFFPIKGKPTPQKELNRVERGLGDPNVITKTDMRDRARGVSKKNVTGKLELTPAKMKRRSQKGVKGQGPIPDQELDLTDHPSESSQYDYLDHNSFEPEHLENLPKAAEPKISDRGFHEFDPSELSQEALSFPKLEDLPRANAKKDRVLTPPKKANRANAEKDRVLTREQQANDALWDRNFSNPEEIKEWARNSLPMGSRDPLCPKTFVTASNPAEADHIVPVERIKQFWGFARLNQQNQLLVLTMRRNYMAVSKSVNSSRNSQSFKEWFGLPGQPVPKDILEYMQALEESLKVQIHGLIDDLLKQQQQIQGTFRPLEGSQELGWRLTGDASRGLRLGKEESDAEESK